MTTPPVVVLPLAPQTPTPFLGEIYGDVEDWINQYDRVARHSGWSDEQRIQNLYVSLERTARFLYENHQGSLTW